jgi:hypothetical protein
MARPRRPILGEDPRARDSALARHRRTDAGRSGSRRGRGHARRWAYQAAWIV